MTRLASFSDGIESDRVPFQTASIQKDDTDTKSFCGYFQEIQDRFDQNHPHFSQSVLKDLYVLLLLTGRFDENSVSAISVPHLIQKQEEVPGMITLMLDVAVALNDSPMLKSKVFWDCFLKYIQCANTTIDSTGKPYLIRIWSEVIARLIQRYDANEAVSPPVYVWSLFQNVTSDAQLELCHKTLDLLEEMSYSPDSCVICVHTALSSPRHPGSSDLTFYLMTCLDKWSISEVSKISIIRHCHGNIPSIALMQWLFAALSDEWIQVIFGEWHPHYRKTFRKLNDLFITFPAIFNNFQWDRMEFFRENSNLEGINWLAVIIWSALDQYGIPSCFSLRFIHAKLKRKDKELFLYLQNGNRLSDYPQLPSTKTITPRQEYFLLNYDRVLVQEDYDSLYFQRRGLHFNNYSGERGFVHPSDFAKLNLDHSLAWIKCLDELLERFLGQDYDTQLMGQAINDNARAVKVLEFMLVYVMKSYKLSKWLLILPTIVHKNAETFQKHEFSGVFWYINNYVFRYNIKVDFGNKEWTVLLQEAEAWSNRYLNNLFPVCPIEGMSLAYAGKAYKIEQISSLDNLCQESKILHHGILEYYRKAVIQGDYFVFQLTEVNGLKEIPCISIIIRPGYPVEGNAWKLEKAKGRYNRGVTVEESIILDMWLMQINIQAG